MKVLLLGGGGFIGTSLTDHLLCYKEIEIRSVSRSFLDKTDDRRGLTRSFAKEIRATKVFQYLDECDAVIDLTTPSGASRHPRDNPESGVSGAISFLKRKGEILKTISDLNKRLILIGSGGTIYGSELERAATEERPHNPNTTYALNTALVANLATFYRNSCGMDVTYLLAANPYGPWQTGANGQGVIGTWISRLLSQKDIEIKGSLNSRRDYIYIDDFCDLVRRVLVSGSRPTHVLYNAGTGQGTTLAAILDAVVMYTQSSRGGAAAYTSCDMGGQDGIMLDSTRAREEFGWKPKTTIEEGIRATVEWFRSTMSPQLLE